MGNTEKRVEQDIMLALSTDGCRVFRNAVGVGYTKDGSVFNYGLCKGSSDIIGITPITITPDMVGKRIGVFTAVEVKKSEKGYGASEDQHRFIKMITDNGGFAGVAYDKESAKKVIFSLYNTK